MIVVGATLLELVTVIAIIAVMAALIFPLVSRTKGRAELTEDIVQMRQVYVAVTSYAEDHNDELSPSLLYVEPYAKSRQVFCSPVDPYRSGIPGVPDFPADMTDGWGPRSPFRISYAYLPPMAEDAGYDATWLRARRDDPSYGLLAVSMYNEPWVTPIMSACQTDVERWQKTEHRIRMDGSYREAHVQAGVTWTCNISGCFGETPPPYAEQIHPNECPCPVPDQSG